MQTATSTGISRTEQWAPVISAVVFSTVVTGLFNLSEFMPIPVAVALGAGWGVLVSFLGLWIRRRASVGAWFEDGLVGLGATGFALAGCGGLMAILLLNGAMASSSLTGETLESTFWPSIPYYIAVNSVLELLIIPLVVVVTWRPGVRRLLVSAAAAMYFLMRVWTYLAFVPKRMGWAESDHTTQVLTAVEHEQASKDLMLDDPRWIMLLIMFGLLIVAASFSRVRDTRNPRAQAER